MRSDQIIRKIRIYAVLSFLIPLFTINLCLFIFKFLGDFNTFPNYSWDSEKIDLNYQQERLIYNNIESWTFTNCPKYKYKKIFNTTDNGILEDTELQDAQSEELLLFKKLESEDKIKSVIRTETNILNKKCVKNSWIKYFLLKNFSTLENFMLLAKENNTSGFGDVKNPYLYGEVSISRTARYFPATLVFKPFIILGAIFLFFYWLNNLNLFKELENRNILVKPSKKFFYFGIFSCVFLILHALFLGLDFESELFSKIRRVIIVLFIVFEIFAQLLLTRVLFEFKEKLNIYINPLFLKIKITFVAIIFAITFISFAFLIWGDLHGTHKHVLEWNYFASLLFYYLLSRLLWKRP